MANNRLFLKCLSCGETGPQIAKALESWRSAADEDSITEWLEKHADTGTLCGMPVDEDSPEYEAWQQRRQGQWITCETETGRTTSV